MMPNNTNWNPEGAVVRVPDKADTKEPFSENYKRLLNFHYKIMDLVVRYPNDQDLGGEIRQFVREER